MPCELHHIQPIVYKSPVQSLYRSLDPIKNILLGTYTQGQVAVKALGSI